MAISITVVFNGITFRRYPNAKHRTERVYFVPGGTDRANGVGRLHEEIWKSVNGLIPEGHHVHHADHNPLNNDISNLMLMTKSEHHSHHGKDPEQLERQQQQVAKIRHLSKAWHASPEGIEWHREHALKQDRPMKPGTCEQCGNGFLSKLPLRFCSNACKSAWRRASGVDDETRICEWCRSEYTVNHYSRVRYCSRACGGKARRIA